MANGPKAGDAKTGDTKIGDTKIGDTVRWQTSQGQTEGTVERIVTATTKVKGHTAKATKEHPEILVRSSRSGKRAVHKPQALKKT